MKCMVFIDILLLIGAVYLFSMCSRTNNIDYATNAPYDINYYSDTINGHIILTTVCNDKNNISVSTIELKD